MMSTIFPPKNLHYMPALLLLTFFSMPVSAATSVWQGPYVGIYVGEGIGGNRVSTDVGTVVTDPNTDLNTSYFFMPNDINAVNQAGTFNKNPNSVIGGIEAGQDWVWNNMVYGVVLDYGALPLNSSKNVNNVPYSSSTDQYSLSTSMSTNWLFTLRGRIGYQTQLYYWPSLFYVTGGMALTQLKVSNNFSDNSSTAGAGESHNTSNEIGWTLGGGIELALRRHLSVNFEYAYLDVPSVKTTGSISNSQGGFGIPVNSLTSPFSTTGKFHANLLKIGLKYRF